MQLGSGRWLVASRLQLERGVCTLCFVRGFALSLRRNVCILEAETHSKKFSHDDMEEGVMRLQLRTGPHSPWPVQIPFPGGKKNGHVQRIAREKIPDGNRTYSVTEGENFRKRFENQMKLLFVCLGNICRSPTAEGIMLHKVKARGLAEKFEIDSAGTGSVIKTTLPPPPAQNLFLKR